MHGDTRGVFHLCRVLRSDLGQPEQNLLNVDVFLKKKKKKKSSQSSMPAKLPSTSTRTNKKKPATGLAELMNHFSYLFLLLSNSERKAGSRGSREM